ncbi:MAG: DUF2169 domain-containing protein [Bdellovibrio bacteriovorus]
MWQLDNRTPFAAERTWVRDRDGAEIWLVAVRCAFDIAPDGTTTPSDPQAPVVSIPEPADPKDPAAGIKLDSDLVRTKVTTDVLLHGQAHAPGGRPVTELDVGFRVGPVFKRLRVIGDRLWRGGSPTLAEPFVRMPLVWTRAFGGYDPASRSGPNPRWDIRNPAGTGFALSAASAEGLNLPNIESLDRPIRHWSDRPEPVGTGPIPAHWEPRAQLAGTYDARWEAERFPLLPLDFDNRHYQCAPRDQQAPRFLTGGEPVVLINLTPSGELKLNLPRIRLGLETFFYTGERRRHDPPRLHSVILEPDLPRVSLVWHSALPCHPLTTRLKHTRIDLKQDLSKGLASRPGSESYQAA